MIGQKALQNTMSNLIESNKLPRFIILIGGYGSGRKTLAKWISTQANMPYVISELGVDNVRQIVDSSYKTAIPTVYIIPNANNLSNIAQNVLLKITEEPPNLAYFIITIENGSQILPTLLNRGMTFNIMPYSVDELRTYLLQVHPDATNYYDILIDVCDSMGEMEDLLEYDIDELIDFVDKVIANIAIASGSNAFKIADRLAVKDTDTGYDLGIFLKAFRARCMDKLMSDKNDLKYADGVVITNRYLQDLQQVKGVNKTSVFDMWMFDCRKAWK